jgi:hypothetical protein
MKTPTPMTSHRHPLLPFMFTLTFGAAAAPSPAHAQDAGRLDSALRFRNAEVVTAVRDAHVGPKPAEREFLRAAYFFDRYVARRSVRAMTPEPATRARGVNALDEVPDSSWFENRVGVRAVAPRELHERPGAAPQPPFAVVGMKEGGTSLGMRVRDARGVGYLLKFGNASGDPSAENATDLVVQRLLWTVGYHTAEDYILDFHAPDLRLDARAKAKNAVGNSRPMNDGDLRRALAKALRRPDGRYQALLSRLLPGVPIGGFPQEGVRADDPNDAIPHEDRRDVRGARVFFAWLNHVDIKEDNFLDAWIEEPGMPGRGRVRHYLVDFGNSMGTFGWPSDQSAGFAQLFDLSQGARSLISFGLWKRPWEGMRPAGLPAVGNFESARFDPGAWISQYPWAPAERFDRFDGSWGARILMRVTAEHVAAAVAEARYDDPRSAAYVTRTLIERQRKLGRHYLAETSPLDSFTVAAHDGTFALCFADPLVEHFGAAEPALGASTRHHVATWGFDGGPLPRRADAAGAVDVCIDGIAPGADHDGYTIVDIRTTRAGTPPGRILVHLARDPRTGEPRVIGLRRL